MYLLLKSEIKEIILDSIKELKSQLSDGDNLIISEDMTIFGKESSFDSFDFVNLIVIIEDHLFEKLGKGVTIVNEKAFSKKYNPFSTVERLTDYIGELLEGEQD